MNDASYNEVMKRLMQKMSKVNLFKVGQLLKVLDWSPMSFHYRVHNLDKRLKSIDQLSAVLNIGTIEFIEDVMGYENKRLTTFISYLDKEFGTKVAETFETAYKDNNQALYEYFITLLTSAILKRNAVEQDI